MEQSSSAKILARNPTSPYPPSQQQVNLSTEIEVMLLIAHPCQHESLRHQPPAPSPCRQQLSASRFSKRTKTSPCKYIKWQPAFDGNSGCMQDVSRNSVSLRGQPRCPLQR